MDGNIEREDTDYFDLGTKLHYYLLQQEEFNKLYTYLEYTTPRGDKQKQFCDEYIKLKVKGKKKDEEATIRAYEKTYVVKGKSKEKIKEESIDLYKNLSKYLTYLEASTTYKDVLNRSTMKFLEEAYSSVQQHKIGNNLLLQNTPDFIDNSDLFIKNEFNIIWKFPKLKVKKDYITCSSTLDRLIIDHKNKTITIIDLKTTSKLNKFRENSFEDYKYYRQLAFYWMSIYWFFKEKLKDKNIDEYKKLTYIVAIQTNTKYSTSLLTECEVFTIKDKWLERGFEEIETLMSKLSWHLENDLWEHSRDYYEGDGAITI